MRVKEYIKPERVLLAYLNYLMLNGNTEGLNLKDFLKFVAELNCELVKEDAKCDVGNGRYYNIIQRANLFINCDDTKTAIDFEIVDNKLTALPTYDFIIDIEHDFFMSLGFSYNQIEILKNLFAKKVKKSSYRFYNFKKFSEQQLSIAKKVGALLVNNLIHRYIKFEISKGRWPVQCVDVDKYIFKKNIAQYIDLKCTSAKCEELYAHAVMVVCKLLNNNSSKILFSTNPGKCLAYANYKKILMLKEFSFLEELEEYTLKEKEFLNVSIEDGIVMFSEEKYINTYSGYTISKSEEKIISEHEVVIMENRIGNII